MHNKHVCECATEISRELHWGREFLSHHVTAQAAWRSWAWAGEGQIVLGLERQPSWERFHVTENVLCVTLHGGGGGKGHTVWFSGDLLCREDPPSPTTAQQCSHHVPVRQPCSPHLLPVLQLRLGDGGGGTQARFFWNLSQFLTFIAYVSESDSEGVMRKPSG